MIELVDKAIRRDKHSVAQLISLFEDQRPQARTQRREVLDALREHPARRHGAFIGITGTPGAGKSSLLGKLALSLVVHREDLSAAVLAIDPSSQFTGGALLGDRTRVRFPGASDRLFFRSQASETDLGGLSPATFQVCRLLHYLFDIVFIETVGIGQSEIDIKFLADHVYLVLAPMGGDEVQFLKAGIMEVPDVIVLNKCDEKEAARRSYHALKASLSLARPFDQTPVPIHRISAKTGAGVLELADAMLRGITELGTPDLAPKERHYFSKWVKDEWGKAGLRFLQEGAGGLGAYLERAGDYDAAQASFGAAFRRWLIEQPG